MSRSTVFLLASSLSFIPLSMQAQGNADTSAFAALSAAAGPAFSQEEQPAVSPASAVPADPSAVILEDITPEQCLSGDETVSAFPGLYRAVPSLENMRIIKVFRYKDARGDERRLEVYYTGGDWMRYGLTYFGANSGLRQDKADAYFINELSTPDQEQGLVPPAISPFDSAKLAQFITGSFLTRGGDVKAAFKSVVTAAVSAK